MSLTLKHTVLSVCQLEKKQAKNKTETQLQCILIIQTKTADE